MKGFGISSGVAGMGSTMASAAKSKLGEATQGKDSGAAIACAASPL
jgi:hypothetical protein